MIAVQNLEVVKKETRILDNINLTIRPGDHILLKGESGSGKSTLIKSIIFFESFSGTVSFNSETVTRENLCDFRRQCGYIGQTTPAVEDTVQQFLEMPFHFKSNQSLRYNRQTVNQLLELLNFGPDVLEKQFTDLSGGEKQRMMILQLMLLDKPVFLLDEVTAALDKKNIRAAIQLLTRDKNKTVISISHNLEWEEYCTRIIEMDRGRIVSDTKVGEGN